MSDVPPLPSTDSGPPPAPTPSRSTTMAWGAGVAAAVIIAASLAYFAGTRTAAPPGDRVTTTTTEAAVTAPPGWTPADTQAMGALAAALERSSALRAERQAVDVALDSCSVSLDDAVTRLDAIIAERTSLVDEVAAVDGTAAVGVAVSLLTATVEFQLAADQAQRRWVDWLTTNAATTYATTCWPAGEGPSTPERTAAEVAEANATAEATSFVTVYNPLATSIGLRAWDVSEF